MKNKVYKVKPFTDINKFAQAGYDIFDNSLIIFKFIPQAMDSQPVQYMVNMYNNPEWQKKFYIDKNKKILREQGIRIKDGKVVVNKKLKDLVTNWRIEIDYSSEEKWLGFTSLDFNDQTSFYGKQYLDAYCAEEIKDLLEKGLIEETEVDE